MKLISLYIENFGGLSRYSLEFSEGVTVIAEPNGFGKTTLAEFIRAMFYGFPRKAKTLDKSKRQKYTPWNGGKCGGNLVFEHQNQRYRIERAFGATPKSDTFKVIDLATNKKTDCFSEEIGLELFQLDADSFERSTYMPQLSGSGSLSTNNIQAKLTRLVEDTGDINHFDKAMETLRGKRSTFVPYRGNGGTVAEARSRISGLQQELDRAEGSRNRLMDCQTQIAGLEEELGTCEQIIASVRRDITAASEAAAAAALHREYGQLMAAKQADQEELTRLGRTYPTGIPTPERIAEAEDLTRQLAILEGRQTAAASDLAARDYTEQNRQRFEGKVPDGAQLEQRRRQHRDMESLLTEARSIGLSEQERIQYGQLLSLTEAGKLESRRLEQLSADHRELERLKSALEHTAMDPAEQQKLARLEEYFSAGVPEKRQLEKLREDMKASQQLRQETAQLAAALPAPQSRKRVSPVPMILALLLGIVAVTAGIVLLIRHLYLAGGLILGIGVIGLVAGVFLGLRMMLSRELSGGAVTPEIRARIDANRMQIEQMEKGITGFTGRYSTQADLAEVLREIEDRAEDYDVLSRRKETIDEKREALSTSALMLEHKLSQELSCGSDELGRAITELYVCKEQFAGLQAEKEAADIRRKELLEQAEKLKHDLTQYLASYYEQVQPERFGALLSRLQRESEEYIRCREQVKGWQERCRQHQEELEACNAGLDSFFREYAMTREDDLPRQLQQIRSDGETVKRIRHANTQRNLRLEELTREKGSLLTETQPEQMWDLEDLKTREQQLTGRHTELTQQLLQAKQDRLRLREEADRIPGLRDELNAWSARKNEDQRKSELLDETMAFLEKAKDSLSGSYLGPVREHFAHYLNRLSGGNSGEILISPELEVQLERQGQARELAFFSAGQTDLVMLCMRLALVDALFGEEKPFVILDDPFVNLDDGRTAEALNLLQDLGKERQILYLVCNSSRTL